MHKPPIQQKSQNLPPQKTALVAEEVINGCKAYPVRIYGDRL